MHLQIIEILSIENGLVSNGGHWRQYLKQVKTKIWFEKIKKNEWIESVTKQTKDNLWNKKKINQVKYLWWM